MADVLTMADGDGSDRIENQLYHSMDGINNDNDLSQKKKNNPMRLLN